MVDIQEKSSDTVTTHSHSRILNDIKDNPPMFNVNPKVYRYNNPQQQNSNFPSIDKTLTEYSITKNDEISNSNNLRLKGKLPSFSPGVKSSSHAAKKPIIVKLPPHYSDVQHNDYENLEQGDNTVGDKYTSLQDYIKEQDVFSPNDNSLLKDTKQTESALKENKDLDTILDSFLDSLIPRNVEKAKDPKLLRSPLEKTLMMSVKSELMLKKNIKPAKINVVALIMDENHTDDARETHEIVEDNILGIVDGKVKNCKFHLFYKPFNYIYLFFSPRIIFLN